MASAPAHSKRALRRHRRRWKKFTVGDAGDPKDSAAESTDSRKMQWSWGLAPLPPWRLHLPKHVALPSYLPPKRLKVEPKLSFENNEKAIEAFEEESDDGDITGVADSDDALEDLFYCFKS